MIAHAREQNQRASEKRTVSTVEISAAATFAAGQFANVLRAGHFVMMAKHASLKVVKYKLHVGKPTQRSLWISALYLALMHQRSI